MKRSTVISYIFFLLLLPIAAKASEIKGVSLGEFTSGCDYYLIEDSMGDYSLVEWYGGITPYSGNVVVGELHSYGFKEIYNISRDNSTRVWIDDWMLSQDSAAEKLIDKCGYDRSISTYFDTDYYVPTKSISIPVVPTCPSNSSPDIDGKCKCNTGYMISGNACVTYNQNCQIKYGINSYGDDKYCYCANGYKWNLGKTACEAVTSCPDSYILNSSNVCVTYTQFCQQLNNNDLNIQGFKGTDGKLVCQCADSYNWNGSACIAVVNDSKMAPSPEVKKQELKKVFRTTTQKSFIFKKEPSRVATTTSPTIIKGGASSTSVLVNIKAASTTQANAKKPSILQNISKFFKKLF